MGVGSPGWPVLATGRRGQVHCRFPMLSRLRERAEWQFFAVLPRADRALALAWWAVLALRGVLPAAFAVTMGVLVAAVQHGQSLGVPLAAAGAVFVLLQVLAPIHQAISANLGSRVAAWLFDRLSEACVGPPGMGHLEDAKLTSDLTVAREFDAGMTGPPMHVNMDFIAGGLVQTLVGLASAAVLLAYAWWAGVVLAGAWLATHWLLRESAVWRDRNTEEVRAAQRDADYAFELAVQPAPAKELRLFGHQRAHRAKILRFGEPVIAHVDNMQHCFRRELLCQIAKLWQHHPGNLATIPPFAVIIPHR